jgi:hypothetical protein
MGWKFWQKEDQGGEKKLPRPKDLPQEVGRHLVVSEGYDPDWVWSLKSVVKPRENSRTTMDIRIFSEEAASQKALAVKDYHSLDRHPDLVLFAGWYDRESRTVKMDNLMKEAG